MQDGVGASARREYVLGHDERELERLDRQAVIFAEASQALLRQAGLAPGMTVLDLGTGTGALALLVAEIVGAQGRVVALDRSGAALERARSKAAAAGATNVQFRVADVARPLPELVADAAVCRLVLAYQDDPGAVLRNWLARLRPGGRLLVMEYDSSAPRSVPQLPLVARALEWVDGAFAAAGQAQRLGPRLPGLLAAAGLQDVRVLGAQPYLPPSAAAAMVSAVVQSLLPVIVGEGVATEDEVAIDSLHQRLLDELQQHDARFCPPTLVGCWGTVAAPG